jgi:hypothetical protein
MLGNNDDGRVCMIMRRVSYAPHNSMPPLFGKKTYSAAVRPAPVPNRRSI